MTTEHGEPTKAARRLIEAAKLQGVTVTSDQLGRWTDEGLIPPPIQISAGRGKGRPSDHYPDGTLERVVIIARLLDSKPRVTLDDLRIWLFLFGDDAFIGAARKAAVEQNRSVRKTLVQMRQRTGLDFVETVIGRVSRAPIHKVITTVHSTKKLIRDSPAYQTTVALAEMMAESIPTDLIALDTFAESMGIDDSRYRRKFRDLAIDARLSLLGRHLGELNDAELIAARDAAIKLVEMVMFVVPGPSDEPWQNKAWTVRSAMRIHAITAIFSVVQIARCQKVYGNVYSRIDEVIDDIRSGRVQYPELGSVES